MIEASKLLNSYIRGIRHLSGAATVSLFVPAPLSGFARPLLIHDGETPPVPEMSDLDAARSNAERWTLENWKKKGISSSILLESEDPDGALVALPAVHSRRWQTILSRQLSGAPQPARRRSDLDPSSGTELPGAWLGLRFPSGKGSLEHRLSSRHLPFELARDQDPEAWWEWLFALGGALASHTTQVAAVLKDPVTGLPDRSGFQAVLAEEVERARLNKNRLSLLFINPDDFAVINERFGREAGDRTVREISSRLRGALRDSDPVARYGGVIFAAILFDSDLEAARSVAEKVSQDLTEGAYLDGAVRLGFSIGIAGLEPDDETVRHPLDLVRRADQALNAAKRLGGGGIVDWEQRSSEEETGNFDRLSGIFTGNMSKDYRNMVLLRDAIDVIARHPEFEDLAAEMVDRLYGSFKPDRVGLFDAGDEGELTLVRGLTRRGPEVGLQPRLETVELEPQDQHLIRKAIAEGEAQDSRRSTAEGEVSVFAVPLVAGRQSLGCLFIEGREENLALDASDGVFLMALGSQLAVALDRARLAELEQKRREHERRQLRAEVNQLRQAIQQAKFVYRSREMESVVATARRVAPTDATILVTGESGTGKELLARTIHEVSPRRDHSFVIVDCGAIATTLIESELFGHEKGAYTGAQQRRAGRLFQANGGTVLLDEIGELPLEVQSKLLRFVQEKQFTSVGGSKPRTVDVRIIAATNRDLASEVRAGRFREDLFYRLNVVRLEVPPLRQRPEDILHLAQHFLDIYAVQYQKNVRTLTADAEAMLLQHQWSGNVRELQNRVMQAVILSDGEEVGPAELGLPAESELPPAVSLPVGRPASPPVTGGQRDDTRVPAGHREATDRSDRPVPPLNVSWQRLRQALNRQIELASGGATRLDLPLGKWLGEDLILEADSASNGVARQGSTLVGIPETTFRRRLRKAGQRAKAGLAPRSGTWGEIRAILRDVVRAPQPDDEDLLERAEEILLQEIVARFPGDVRTGSALLGVTPPTFRRRLAELEASRADAVSV